MLDTQVAKPATASRMTLLAPKSDEYQRVEKGVLETAPRCTIQRVLKIHHPTLKRFYVLCGPSDSPSRS